MKRIIITTALLLGTALAAQAYPVAKYYDLIRPHGHPRSDAVHQADLDFCYAQTGQSRYSFDGPAFKKCMLSRGYRFMSQYNAPNPRSHSAPADDDWTPPESPPAMDPNTLPQPPQPMTTAPMFDSSGNIIPGTGGF